MSSIQSFDIWKRGTHTQSIDDIIDESINYTHTNKRLVIISNTKFNANDFLSSE